MASGKMFSIGKLLLGLLALVAVSAALYVSRSDPRDLANSDDPGDRKRAARALAESGSEADREKLEQLVSDPDPWVGRYAVRGLEDPTKLRRILSDKSLHGAVRGEAAAQLGKKGGDAEALTRVLDPGGEPEAKVRAGAAKGLGFARDPEAIPQLVEALEDPDREVRIWAITAIHRMIARRFPFDASKPPGTQRAEIRRIEEYLRKAGAL